MAKAKTKKVTKSTAKGSSKSPTKKASKKTTKKSDKTVKVDRRSPNAADPREKDRRQEVVGVEDDQRESSDRRKVTRRRQIDPTTCERDYNNEEIEFMHALDAYKRAAGRMFPTCSEILEVVRGLGYHRLTPDQIATLGLNRSFEPDTETGEAQVGAADANAFSEASGVEGDNPFDNESLEDFEG